MAAARRWKRTLAPQAVQVVAPHLAALPRPAAVPLPAMVHPHHLQARLPVAQRLAVHHPARQVLAGLQIWVDQSSI